MSLSLIAKIRSRRAIRTKLDEVSRIVNSPRIGEHSVALFGGTECAIVTEDGDILTGKAGSSKPFAAVAPKVRQLRTSADRVGQYLSQKAPNVVHVRGESGMVSAYDLGQHTLVTYTEVSPGARNLDAVVARVDRALGIDGDASKLIDDLKGLLADI